MIRTIGGVDIEIVSEVVSIDPGTGLIKTKYAGYYKTHETDMLGRTSTFSHKIGTYSSVSNVLRAHRNLQKKERVLTKKEIECFEKAAEDVRIDWSELEKLLSVILGACKDAKVLRDNGIRTMPSRPKVR